MNILVTLFAAFVSMAGADDSCMEQAGNDRIAKNNCLILATMPVQLKGTVTCDFDAGSIAVNDCLIDAIAAYPDRAAYVGDLRPYGDWDPLEFNDKLIDGMGGPRSTTFLGGGTPIEGGGDIHAILGSEPPAGFSFCTSLAKYWPEERLNAFWEALENGSERRSYTPSPRQRLLFGKELRSFSESELDE